MPRPPIENPIQYMTVACFALVLSLHLSPLQIISLYKLVLVHLAEIVTLFVFSSDVVVGSTWLRILP
jgi:hypothetical protein